MLYKWGYQTNYPGDERTTSFIFVTEAGKWKQTTFTLLEASLCRLKVKTST